MERLEWPRSTINAPASGMIQSWVHYGSGSERMLNDLAHIGNSGKEGIGLSILKTAERKRKYRYTLSKKDENEFALRLVQESWKDYIIVPWFLHNLKLRLQYRSYQKILSKYKRTCQFWDNSKTTT